ncbi:MAG TPA: putative LPS assembly protein LptD, partial [Chitinophagaceae bacterium]|nr:putative LPS assembly protein LptD [Chitinophagaceae bacterium]
LPRIDTFDFRISSDTLGGPVEYEAEDSAVVLVQDKRILLYGKTKTVHQDITLTAPEVALDQRTNIVTARADRDSSGYVRTRARFEQGSNQFESDSMQFNFKTQRGLTTNTFTQQNEMFVQGRTIKKVDNNTFFVKEGRFTTCNLDHPHFAFKTNKMKLINNKVAVSGPMHPEFEEVPVPVYLPFGFYPLSQGRHSGFLAPTFTTNEDFGIGLEGLGYYKVLNDNFDVMLRTNLYSYGGWSAMITPTYRVRYRYSGSLNLNIQNTKFNFKGDPDYRKVRTFQVNWNHTVDQRARPGVTFSASVNAGSTKHNQYLVNRPLNNFQNQLSSSIAYSKSWAGKPYFLTLSANHNQNNNLNLVNLSLPDASFSVQTLYPFQRKEIVGTPKWYEKLGIGYNGSFRNQVSFYDTARFSLSKLLDTVQWGANHSIPLTVSLPPLGPFIVSPGISYSEVWLAQKVDLSWNQSRKRVDTAFSKGFYSDRQMSFSLGFSTALYGTFQFRKSRLAALRHVMRPTFGFSYRPNLSKRYYDITQIDSTGRKYQYAQLAGGFGYGRSGGITFGIDNNLEAKWRSRKDTGDAAIKKIR